MIYFNWEKPSKNKVSKTIEYMKKDRICRYCGKHASILDRWINICKDKECRLKHYRHENDLHK